jgi:hypothetical protein
VGRRIRRCRAAKVRAGEAILGIQSAGIGIGKFLEESRPPPTALPEGCVAILTANMVDDHRPPIGSHYSSRLLGSSIKFFGVSLYTRSFYEFTDPPFYIIISPLNSLCLQNKSKKNKKNKTK